MRQVATRKERRSGEVGERFERNTHQLTAPIASSAEGGGPAAGKIPFMVYSGEVPRSLHGVKEGVSAWNRKQLIRRYERAI